MEPTDVIDLMEAPQPGQVEGWLDEAEEAFFTMPPAGEREESEDDEVPDLYQARSDWPARIFLGTCVAAVAAIAVVAIVPLLLTPETMRYPANEVIADLDTGVDLEVQRATSRSSRRTRRARTRPTPAKQAATTPMPGPVTASTASSPKTPREVPQMDPNMFGAAREAPMRVDALPALSVATLEPGAAL